jgi:hypothetical protein
VLVTADGEACKDDGEGPVGVGLDDGESPDSLGFGDDGRLDVAFGFLAGRVGAVIEGAEADIPVVGVGGQAPNCCWGIDGCLLSAAMRMGLLMSLSSSSSLSTSGRGLSSLLRQSTRVALRMWRTLVWLRLRHSRQLGGGGLSTRRMMIPRIRLTDGTRASRKKLWVWWGTWLAMETAPIIKLRISADTPHKGGRICLGELTGGGLLLEL